MSDKDTEYEYLRTEVERILQPLPFEPTIAKLINFIYEQRKDGYNEGWQDGWDDGNSEGYDDGYEAGRDGTNDA